MVGKNLYRLHLILVLLIIRSDRNAFTVKLEKYILEKFLEFLTSVFPADKVNCYLPEENDFQDHKTELKITIRLKT